MTIVDPFTTPLPPYVPPYIPYTNITPFTYRDGLTFLEKVESFQAYINNYVIPFINDNFTTLGKEFTDEVNKMIDTVNAALAAQDAEVDQKIADLTQYVNDTMAQVLADGVQLQDPVMHDIIANTASASRMLLETLYSRLRDIDVKTYGAKGDGVTDDTTALQQAINAAINQGLTLRVPAGVYMSDLLVINGVNGPVNINMIGRIKRKNNSTRGALITFLNCIGIFATALRTDGNVANNNYIGFAVDETKQDITIDNCKNVNIVVIDSLNPAGDSLYIRGGATSSSSNIDIAMVSSVSDNLTGRNAVSIIKGHDIAIGQILSINTGHPGQASPAQIAMPGGLDIEPNSATDLVNGVTIGIIRVQTAGSSGFNLFSTFGQIISNVSIGSVIVEPLAGKLPGSTAGVVRGTTRVRIQSYQYDGKNLANGFALDDSTDVRIDLNVSNIIGNLLTLGASAAVNRFRLTGKLDTASIHVIVIYAANDGKIDMTLKNPANGSIVINKNAVGTSSNLTFLGDYSKDVSGSLCFSVGIAVTRWLIDGVDFTGWGVDTRVKGVGANGVVKRNCMGLNYGTAAPNFDVWTQGDIIWNTAVVAAGIPGWICTTGGTPGSGAIFKAMAILAP